MTWHCLIETSPLDQATGERDTLRFCAAQDRRITGALGEKWVPALTKAPTTSIELFDGNFASGVTAGRALVPINLLRAQGHYPKVNGYYWTGAPLRILIGKPGEVEWAEHFVGRVSSGGRDGGVLSLSAEVDTEPFKVDLLTATYAGTGGAEGTADIKGKVKPLALGRPRNVEPVPIDTVNNVHQFSGYGPIEAVEKLYERADDFGPPVADYPTYTAMIAASIPNGSWATCLAQGMIRLGAPNYGVITGDIRGHKVGVSSPRLTGAILTMLAGMADIEDRLEAGAFAALDIAAPYPVSLWLDSQVSFMDLAQRMALPCNHQIGVSLLGKLFAMRVTIGGAGAFTLHAQGKDRPQVLDSKQLPVQAPYSETRMAAARNYRVHRRDEIATGRNLRDLWEPTATYRYDDLVFLGDGSFWLYVNSAPTAGVQPADGSAYWVRQTSGAVGATKSLNPDPSFAQGASGWSGFVRRLPKSDAAVPTGCPYDYAAEFNQRSNLYSQSIQVSAGEQYRASCWVNKGTGGGGVGLGVVGIWILSNGTTSGFAFPGYTNAAGWQRVTGVATAPANAVALQFGPWADRTSYTGEAWYADLHLEKLIDDSLLADESITADKMKEDEGVDVAALVPGEFNTQTSASGTITATESQTIDFAQTTAFSAFANDYITISTLVTVSGGVTNGSNVVQLFRVRNGTPTLISSALAPANGAAGTVALTFEDTTHGGGSIYYKLRVVIGTNDFNDPSMTGSGRLSVRKFFIK